MVTFDALLNQTDHAKFLVEEKGAHYIVVLKGNHPTRLALVKDPPWKEVPLMDQTHAADRPSATRGAHRGDAAQSPGAVPSRDRFDGLLQQLRWRQTPGDRAL